jgi:AraC family transcriptional regulator
VLGYRAADVPSERDILALLSDLRDGFDGDVSIEALGARAGWSPFHLHRAFRRVVGETPKQYTQRLRLNRAAARLVTSDEPVVSIAAGVGFASHAVCTRAFRRHFGRSPADYRHTHCGARADVRARHAALTAATGPCVGLFHLAVNHRRRTAMPTLSIERRELPVQPILFVRRRAARHELSGAIGEGVGQVYLHAQKAGLALAGHPFTRYQSSGPGLFTIEVGFRVAEGVGRRRGGSRWRTEVYWPAVARG